PGQSRRRLLRGEVRPRSRQGRGAGDRGRIHQGLPLAIHPLGRPAPALRQGAFQPDHRKPGPAHPGGARHAPMIQPELSPPPKQRRPIMVTQPKTAEPNVVNGITLENLEIQTDGDIDLRGFLGVDPTVPPGYENLSYIVRIKGSGTKEDFAEIHDAVIATSPNFYNVSRPVALKPTLVVE